jgi:hypothetical protein
VSAPREIVRPVVGEHRAAEARRVTLAFSVIKAVALACVIFPAFGVLVDHLAVGAIVAVLVGWALRIGARRVRWWFEDRADAATAAAWRAEHWKPNHVLAQDVPETGPAPAPEIVRAAA